MAYLIQGSKRPLVFLANPRTGSYSIADALLQLGAEKHGGHHHTPNRIPPDSIIAHTIRHHCDVIVSYWFKGQIGVPLKEFVDTILSGGHGWIRPWELYGRWGDLPNFELRYTNLREDWFNLCDEAGVPRLELVRTVSSRPQVPWQEFFTTDLYERVYARYKDEMDQYGFNQKN